MQADALRAEAWAGEPFLHPEEDPEVVLGPGTARRRALDDALEEIAAGHKSPSSEWKIRYALMLGLERVLSERPPRLASGTELRRHQVDALAGMLTELIAAAQKGENGNGNGHDEPAEEDDEPDDELRPGPRRAPTRTTSRSRSRPTRTRVRRADTGSGTRRRQARRSPPPASSRQREPRAS